MKLTKIANLPAFLKLLRADIDKLGHDLQKVNHIAISAEKNNSRTNEHLNVLRKRLDEIEHDIKKIQAQHIEIDHKINIKKAIEKKDSQQSPQGDVKLFADNHDLDNFYLEFENHFRGDIKEIRKKQTPYIKELNSRKIKKGLPVADLGCGRGEFLQLLADNGYRPLGVDLNDSMVKEVKGKGFDAVENDAISFLLEQSTNSLAAITGFHLAEHIPFEDLLTLLGEANRCLVPGGVLILETPNPESLFVGAFTFHYDPSHLKPLPPAIVQFSAKFKGFKDAEILRLQPELTLSEIKKATDNKVFQDALQRLYGPRDYALVATK